MRPRRGLSEEDRVLWSLIARTVKPLAGTALHLLEQAAPLTMEQAVAPSPTPAPAAQPKPAARRPQVPVPLDKPTHDRIAKGRVPIEGRVDLHGLFQDQAHALLLSFLRRAHAEGARHVLVITGKGSSGDGVLRRAVPGWLATGPFREIVSGFDHAARGHGGTGALYVRLRRKTA